MTTIYLTGKEPLVRQLIDASFPSFNGKKIVLRTSTSVDAGNYSWQSGTLETKVFVSLSEPGKAKAAPYVGYLEKRADLWNVPLAPGVAMVTLTERTDYRSISIDIHPDSLAAGLLPAPNALSENQRKCLKASCELKSSYAGIRNYRQQESGLTPSEWQEAKDSLISLGLLNKAGAVTVDGRNAHRNK